MVHAPFQIPTAISDAQAKGWRRRLSEVAQTAGWPEAATEASLKAAVDWAFDRVIGEANRQVQSALNSQKTLPFELFYTLFNFTNLDNLGFEIEEALLPPNVLPPGRANRARKAIRRDDLFISNIESSL